MKFFTTKAYAAEKARADAAEDLAKLNAEDNARLRVEMVALEAQLSVHVQREAVRMEGLRKATVAAAEKRRKPVLEMVA